MYITFKNSAPISHKTCFICIANIKWLMQFRVVHSENHTKHTNTVPLCFKGGNGFGNRVIWLLTVCNYAERKYQLLFLICQIMNLGLLVTTPGSPSSCRLMIEWYPRTRWRQVVSFSLHLSLPSVIEYMVSRTGDNGSSRATMDVIT
jgi:hypothetical protein